MVSGIFFKEGQTSFYVVSLYTVTVSLLTSSFLAFIISKIINSQYSYIISM